MRQASLQRTFTKTHRTSADGGAMTQVCQHVPRLCGLCRRTHLQLHPCTAMHGCDKWKCMQPQQCIPSDLIFYPPGPRTHALWGVSWEKDWLTLEPRPSSECQGELSMQHEYEPTFSLVAACVRLRVPVCMHVQLQQPKATHF